MTLELSAALPNARGPVSDTVLAAFAGPADAPLSAAGVADADPLGDDVQLALHLCYELHYRGLAGVPEDREWDASLLAWRAVLEARFLDALRAAVPGGDDVEQEFTGLLSEPVDGTGVSHFLRDEGQWWQLREMFAHRSIYHLKEADPHAWVIPRLHGRAKAALVAVEFDEFGGGRAERVHAQLFADLLRAAGLPADYLALLDRVPAPMLAIVNMMSLFGLHRRLRGALVGHFAAAEITTAPSAQRLDQALERLGGPAECRFFYTEHVEADAVHEQVMRTDVVGGLLSEEPELAADVVFGIQATGYLEGRLEEHLLGAWRSGKTSLRQSLD
ncbi:iron-containing redox enzyme family protein [Amycolatopsis jiangsuensis]|uniref:Heme oxygenase-like protein n=1 Tax=Amycolatopsis jiangsuensis TaxID=1181879 RepID=A0A840J615_9PSEU|nr:iron-containing redox enzyme family protein [Amycolatopsis jiangsuensis]MBB4689129.1 hypothetical protein [Amycolatopsis jiangsuensis]